MCVPQAMLWCFVVCVPHAVVQVAVATASAMALVQVLVMQQERVGCHSSGFPGPSLSAMLCVYVLCSQL